MANINTKLYKPVREIDYNPRELQRSCSILRNMSSDNTSLTTWTSNFYKIEQEFLQKKYFCFSFLHFIQKPNNTFICVNITQFQLLNKAVQAQARVIYSE